MGADAISQFEQNGWFASVRPGARVRVAANHMHSSRDEGGSSVKLFTPKYGNARAGAHSLVAVRLRIRVFQEPLRLGLLQYIPERVSVLVALLGH